MFKIGDKVKCIAKPERGDYQFKGNPINKVYVIYNIASVFGIPVFHLKHEVGIFEQGLFVLYRKPKLISEIDYLDAFQRNFKEE